MTINAKHPAKCKECDGSLSANSMLNMVQCEIDVAISHMRELAAAQKARLVKQIDFLEELAMLSGR